MQTLNKGSTGPAVGLLRRLLNRKMMPSPNLPEANLFGARYNGAMARIDFGPQMDTAVRAFQRSKRLKDDGIVGRLTWGALGLTLDISRPVSPSSQPTSDTCYAAAAAMVLGPAAAMSFAPGPTPPGVAPDDHWARTFSRMFRWRLEYGMSPMPNALVDFLRAGAFWFAGNLPFPNGLGYHAVVVGAIWGDGDPDRTMLLIYDPWPVNVGEVYGIILGNYVRSFPRAFRYILHR
jgi:peptidoglycan hydrolase-like protein with peptidoglycan-binding domain